VWAFDGTVLMGNASVVAGRRHAVMAAQLFVAAGQIGAGILVEIAECGRQAVGAVLPGNAA